MKTNQSIAKRFKVTKRGKILKRVAGQAHFNSRENGKVGRNKKSDLVASQTLKRVMAISMPKR